MASLAFDCYWLQLLMATCYIALVWAKWKTLSPTVILLHSNGNDVIMCLLCHCLGTDDISCNTIRSCHTMYSIFYELLLRTVVALWSRHLLFSWYWLKLNSPTFLYRLTIANFITIYWIVLKSMQTDSKGLQWSSTDALSANIM